MTDDLDGRLSALLAVPERAPDRLFVNDVALRLAAERKLAVRLAADRARTATLVVATLAVGLGLWLFAQGGAFAAASAAAGEGGAWGLAAIGATMLLWLGIAGRGALAVE